MNSSGFEKDSMWDRDCTVLGHAMRDPVCMGQGLHSVGTCYERSCLCGTGTAQCWDML